jgi:carbon starvation protein
MSEFIISRKMVAMHAAPIMILVLCALALGYRYYSAFLAAKVAVLDDSRGAGFETTYPYK